MEGEENLEQLIEEWAEYQWEIATTQSNVEPEEVQDNLPF